MNMNSIILFFIAWLSSSLAETIDNSNYRPTSSSELKLNTADPTLLRVPVVLNGESIELIASASMTSEELRAHVVNQAAKYNIQEAGAVEQLCAALEAEASEASSNADSKTYDNSISDATAQAIDKKAMLAAAYEELKHKLQLVESDFADLRIRPSTVRR